MSENHQLSDPDTDPRDYDSSGKRKRHPGITAARWMLLDHSNLEEITRQYPWMRGPQPWSNPEAPIYYQVTHLFTQHNFRDDLVFSGLALVRCEKCHRSYPMQTNYVRRGEWRCLICVPKRREDWKTTGYIPVVRNKPPQHGTLYEATRWLCPCELCQQAVKRYNEKVRSTKSVQQAERRKMYGRGGKRKWLLENEEKEGEVTNDTTRGS